MNLLTVALCFLVIQISYQQTYIDVRRHFYNSIKVHQSECFEATSPNPELIKSFFENVGYPDKSLNCFIDCILRKSKMVVGDSESPEMLQKALVLVSNAFVNDMYKQCPYSKSIPPCEASHQVFACIHNYLINTLH